jgi:peptide/nickel transport system substrate-binding protein
MITRRASALLALVAVLAACRGDSRGPAGSGDTGGTVVLSTAAEPDFLLPPLITNVQGKMITDLVFDRLAEVGADMNVFNEAGYRPRLAKKWTWSPDSLSIAFELDPRAKWHDGAPVRAEDVKLGFELMSDKQVNSPQAPNVSEIDSVTVRDSMTPVFWFKRRTTEEFFTATYNVIPLPAHLLRDAKRDNLQSVAFARSPVGNGRFRFVRWVPGQLVELVADTTNYRGRAKLDRVVLSIAPDPTTAATRLLAGEADFYEVLRGEQLEQAKQNPAIQLAPYGGVDYAFLQLNLHDRKNRARPHAIFGDKGVRHALTMAIDRQAIVKNVYDTLADVPYGPAPRSLGIADKSIKQLAYDTLAARRVLDSLGWRDTNGDGIREKNGVPLRFAVMVPASSRARQNVAVLLQEQLKHSGIDMQVEQLDVNTMIARLSKRDFDAVINAWHPDPNPSSIRQSWGGESARSPNGSNYGGYDSKAFDAYVDSAVMSGTGTAPSYFRKAYQVFVDDAPAVMLYEPRLVAGASKRIKLVELRPDAWWSGLADWSIPADQRIDRDRVGLRAATQ